MKRLFERVGEVPPASALPDADLLAGIGWAEFERQVAEGFRHRGYAVSETGGGGGRAVDMVLTRGQDRFLVDCKPWRTLAVGPAPVRELVALVRSREAAGGFVVSSGEFTDEARQLAESQPVQLIDGKVLRELLNTREEKTQPVVVRREGPFLDTTLPPSAWRLRAQPCPLCGGAMEEAERNGRRVLACVHHPLCEGMREV
ncbi:restriction endonuclease [Piscinibacter gummiphilus]|uniref:Restriction endonuclease n=1 Tax=Piscinibacter gummiphilus TaxID=946333 RepID=A0ABZ0CTR7_9BURK|nr:restriction endonuclease [Piscinibacter gummiphilus]WOB08377.1 restriction endonuclease [Piscinibacter gummiphilus]